MSIRADNEAKPSGRVWDVFARTRDEEALHHVGDVIAPGAGLARASAYQLYQESPWVEMCVVHRSAMVAVEDRA
jgi:1,2-phenylacetyl-CoA epoxidase PaaB subunit